MKKPRCTLYSFIWFVVVTLALPACGLLQGSPAVAPSGPQASAPAATLPPVTQGAPSTALSPTLVLPTELPTVTPAQPTLAPAPLPTFTPPPVITVAPPAGGEVYAVVDVAPSDALNVRSGPGVGYDILGTIPAYGMGVAITGPLEKTYADAWWAPVRYGELGGWVNTHYLALQAGSASPELARRANEVIQALKNGDMGALAGYVHPEKGLRFSPYSFVSQMDLLFGAGQVRMLSSDETIYTWGRFDGSGAPITMKFPQYYQRFVYDVDFARPQWVGFNWQIGRGNTIQNIAEFYPGAAFVEYHFDGFNPEYSGMDWRSLRLVFEDVGGVWYLVGIVHDEWTI